MHDFLVIIISKFIDYSECLDLPVLHSVVAKYSVNEHLNLGDLILAVFLLEF